MKRFRDSSINFILLRLNGILCIAGTQLFIYLSPECPPPQFSFEMQAARTFREERSCIALLHPRNTKTAEGQSRWLREKERERERERAGARAATAS